MKLPKPEAGDFWGGLAAILVALPSAIAYGVTIYSPLGASYAAQGALAGLLGVTALGLIAPALGGTSRLITTPCAPAAAVLSAFALEFIRAGGGIESALLMVSLLGLLAGLLQILFGALRLGRLIVYMPYTVVNGYLSGVGLYIIACQMPRFLGAPNGAHFWESLATPAFWKWQSIVVGMVTIIVMRFAPRFTKRVPAAILALLAGVLTYFVLGLGDPALLTLKDNPFVVGSLGAGENVADAMAGRWHAMYDISLDQMMIIAAPALTLAVLLSIDTLKACVMLDALTRSRHNSNRELIAQGLGNAASAVIGGIPGSGAMGATLVNISCGAVSRFSGVFEGVLALLVFLVLGTMISWMPIAALAAILMVVGVRMIDFHSLHFLRQRSTILDFTVIAVVVVTALTVSLIAASGVGIVLALLLFIREQMGGTIVRRKVYCHQIFSKHVRTHEEMDILVANGKRAVVVELQGSLFFGTANQLYSVLEPELRTRDYVILDMRRVQSVDVTAAHILEQVKDTLADRGGFLIFSQLPQNLPSGRDIQQYFDQVGIVRPDSLVRVFGELDEALEWVEDRILKDVLCGSGEQRALALNEIELFKDFEAEPLLTLERSMITRTYKAGEQIFKSGDSGDELFLIRGGAVRIMLPLSAKQSRHLGTFGRGAFFGEMAFLDGEVRSADAVAFSDTELYVLTRKAFDALAEEHEKLAIGIMGCIASVLASRLRYMNAELRMLES